MTQLKHFLGKLSVEISFVDSDDPEAWRAAIRPNTKAFYGETIGNPGGNVLDIATVAAMTVLYAFIMLSFTLRDARNLACGGCPQRQRRSSVGGTAARPGRRPV